MREQGKDLGEAEITADENYKEIFRLEQMLLSEDIPYDLHRYWDGWQIEYPNGEERVCSVIQHFGSYGSQDDLLEIMGITRDGEPVEGWLQAEDAFNRILAHYKGCVMKL